MYWLTIGIFGTTPPLLFAVEFVTFVLPKPSDGELILLVVTAEFDTAFGVLLTTVLDVALLMNFLK